MRTRFALFLTGMFCMLLSSLPARAVSIRNHDAFLGYSRLGSNAFYPGVGGLNGWNAALHIHVAPFFGVEGDVAHYGLGTNASVPRTTTVLVGPRVSVRALGINLFVHGLVGGVLDGVHPGERRVPHGLDATPSTGERTRVHVRSAFVPVHPV